MLTWAVAYAVVATGNEGLAVFMPVSVVGDFVIVAIIANLFKRSK